MKKITKKGIFIDFGRNYCSSKEEVLSSELFSSILDRYIKSIERRKLHYYKELIKDFKNNEELKKEIIVTCKLCLVFNFKDIVSSFKNKKESFLELIEGLYNYYRKFERYSYVIVNKDSIEMAKSYLRQDQNFNNLILDTYRKISENIKEEHYNVYRQLNAGSNAGFILEKSIYKFDEKYTKLNKINMINSIVLHPPFIVYPKNTKREGIFRGCEVNPIEYLNDTSDFILYPIYVGRFIAYCYFNIEYASLGVSLANLFTPVKRSDLNKKPDIIFMYGVENENLNEPYYYKDEDNMYVGITPLNTEMTYFGYMKKMLLTMHNLKCIDNKELPLHGAMVSLTLINEKKTNIIIVGDSGAGKSESLEALKNILDDDISEMVTVFDDMGVVSKDLIAYGTETGAFVRMDDLDNGYAYQEIDRAILMNPDKKNARTIIPISSLDDIIKGHNVDIILYANNYSDKEGIKVFNDYKEALNVFKEGKRKAKATTSEEGIVTSYFANPFGPVQRQEEVDILLEKYFKEFSDRGIIIGELYTRLGILNEEKSGPLGAAKALVKFIK